ILLGAHEDGVTRGASERKPGRSRIEAEDTNEVVCYLAPAAVSLDTEHPSAGLPVVANLTTAEEAGVVILAVAPDLENICDDHRGPSAAEREAAACESQTARRVGHQVVDVVVAPRRASMDADVEAGPAEGRRNHYRRLHDGSPAQIGRRSGQRGAGHCQRRDAQRDCSPDSCVHIGPQSRLRHASAAKATFTIISSRWLGSV